MSARGNTAGWRTTREVDRRYAGGRSRRRYAGRGKRGKPSRAHEDLTNVRLALHELVPCVELLSRLDANDALTRAESVAAHREVLAKIALAGRALDEVTLRPIPQWNHRRAS